MLARRWKAGDRSGRGAWIIAAGILLAASGAAAQVTNNSGHQSPAPVPMQDTLYVLDSLYLEVDLDRQEIYRHYSDGRLDTFLCSTGNPNLSRGLATRPGIFTIKWKAKSHVSSAFDVRMYYWMPFDGGIGFHSLAGDDYYIHLGYEPSSHGCVRLSNESAEELFRATPTGTVVYVHRGVPARTLSFASGTAADLRIVKPSDAGLLRRRLDAVRKGDNDPALLEQLALPHGFPSKIDVGELAGPTVSLKKDER